LNRHDAKAAKDAMFPIFPSKNANRFLGLSEVLSVVPHMTISVLAILAPWRLIFSDWG